MPHARPVLAALVAVIAAFSLVACSEESAPPASEEVSPAVETADEPASGDLEVVATDYAFEFPSEVAAGNHQIQLNNQGEEIHEAIVVELLEGKTIEDVEAYVRDSGPDSPPPSWVRVAGIGFADPGASGPVAATDESGEPSGDPADGIDLTAGSYVLVCFVPEGTVDQDSKPAKDAMPHVALGMVHEFTVA